MLSNCVRDAGEQLLKSTWKTTSVGKYDQVIYH